MNFFEEYFIKPIWDRSGYNPVNTITYAIIALIFAYLIYIGLKKLNIKIDKKFVISILPFILFGSTLRVITDATDSGIITFHREYLFGLMGWLIDLNIYNYGYLTTTPGIYFVVGFITLTSIFILHKIKKLDLLFWVGMVLFLSQLILLLPLFKFWLYALLILFLCAIGTLLSIFILKYMKIPVFSSLPVLAHSLDGSATFVAINIFAHGKYFEQHVVSRIIGDIGSLLFGSYGMFLFFLIKVIFSLLAVIIIEKETKEEEEKFYVFLLLVIFGLAPGMRDLLRLLCGT